MAHRENYNRSHSFEQLVAPVGWLVGNVRKNLGNWREEEHYAIVDEYPTRGKENCNCRCKQENLRPIFSDPSPDKTAPMVKICPFNQNQVWQLNCEWGKTVNKVSQARAPSFSRVATIEVDGRVQEEELEGNSCQINKLMEVELWKGL